VLERVVQGLFLRVMYAILRRSVAIVTVWTHMFQCTFTYDGTSLLRTLRMQSAGLILFKIVCNWRQAILITHHKLLFVDNLSLRIVLHYGEAFVPTSCSLVIFT
jgi:uncharacterized membrane protein